MTTPFHLSLVVADLTAARAFYHDILGCPLGRDKGEWCDILFYGNQLTIHQERDGYHALAIDHFGVILGKGEWDRVTTRLHDAGIAATIEIKPGDGHAQTDSGKCLVQDPAGNVLEFKYYADTRSVPAGAPVRAADSDV